jgi:hypothetical protein
MRKTERESLKSLLSEAQLALEKSDPPKGGYTRDLIGRIKRQLNRKYESHT